MILESVVVPTDRDYLGVAFVAGPRSADPGAALPAEFVCLYHPAVDYAALSTGARFRLVEGDRVIAEGEVVERPLSGPSDLGSTQRVPRPGRGAA